MFTELLPSIGRGTHAHRQQGDPLNLLLFFQDKESKLKLKLRPVLHGNCCLYGFKDTMGYESDAASLLSEGQQF
jgi:hypothetical protein